MTDYVAVLSLAGEERSRACAPMTRPTGQDGGRQVIEALRGCVDIDISATLLANTLRNDI